MDILNILILQDCQADCVYTAYCDNWCCAEPIDTTFDFVAGDTHSLEGCSYAYNGSVEDYAIEGLNVPYDEFCDELRILVASLNQLIESGYIEII